MNAFLSLGRWLFAIPFAVLGLFHFLDTSTMAEMVVPAYLPVKSIWVYLSGAGMIAAAVSMVSGRYDKLACTLLAIMLLTLCALVHIPGYTNGNQFAMSQLLKDMALAGAAMMYAMEYAKDKSVIG